ncbi:farnesyldiphosphatesynthetase, partial [Coprinopsis sp. MPI-PUGE-AT-0042]
MSSSDKAARRARFEASWTEIRDEILSYFASEHMPAEAIEWYKANLDYNVPGGKLNRGMSVCDTVEILKGRALTDEEYKPAAVLGWCIELLQAFFLVSDDMMDGSITRRGQPCWYKVPNVGMLAINDSFMLEAPIYFLIRKYFRFPSSSNASTNALYKSVYADLMDLFHETTYQTEMGQLVDLITAPEDHVDLEKFSLERHRLIVIYKTAYYSFYLPVACAMLICGIPFPDKEPKFDFLKGGFGGESAPADADPYTIALSILIPLGEYFQVQDDFLDYSAPPEVLGKIGTDIMDNKCSWVINTALALTSPSSSASSPKFNTPFAAKSSTTISPQRKSELRAILDKHYGKKTAEDEAKIKEVYRELDVPSHYKTYEEGVVGEIKRRIGESGDKGGLRRAVFDSFLDKIYGRS